MHFRRTAIKNILKINPQTIQEEIAKQINKSVRAVKLIWQKCKKSLIKRKNGKKNGEWQVNE